MLSVRFVLIPRPDQTNRQIVSGVTEEPGPPGPRPVTLTPVTKLINRTSFLTPRDNISIFENKSLSYQTIFCVLNIEYKRRFTVTRISFILSPSGVVLLLDGINCWKFYLCLFVTKP